MTDPRTGLADLPEDRCWALLAGKDVGRLAVSVQNRPDIFPVNYRLDGRSIMIKSAAGLKLAAATLGQGVAFEVDDLDEHARSGWSVVVIGDATELESLEEILDADELGIQPWAGGFKNRYFRIVPTSVTGRQVLR